MQNFDALRRRQQQVGAIDIATLVADKKRIDNPPIGIIVDATFTVVEDRAATVNRGIVHKTRGTHHHRFGQVSATAGRRPVAR